MTVEFKFSINCDTKISSSISYREYQPIQGVYRECGLIRLRLREA